MIIRVVFLFTQKALSLSLKKSEETMKDPVFFGLSRAAGCEKFADPTDFSSISRNSTSVYAAFSPLSVSLFLLLEKLLFFPALSKVDTQKDLFFYIRAYVHAGGG